MTVEEDLARTFSRWEGSARSLVLRYRDIGRSGLDREQWQRRADLINGSKALVSALEDDLCPAGLGRAVRRAAQGHIQAQLICRDVQHATHVHPEGPVTLEPLFEHIQHKARAFRMSERGIDMLVLGCWAACVGHGIPGARLPARPGGILADLTRVPPRIEGAGQDEGHRAQGGGMAGHEPSWRR